MTDQDRTVRQTVIGTDGTIWVVNARTASDYLFNPVFMVFFVICAVLYAILMQSTSHLDLPVVVQLLMWSGYLMTSILWLLLCLLINMFLINLGIVRVIFTPLCLLPLVFINSALSETILTQFNALEGYSSTDRWNDILRNAVVFLCFDLLHTHFVAPRHPAYVPSVTGEVKSAKEQTAPPTPVVPPVQAVEEAVAASLQDRALENRSTQVGPPARTIKIGSTTLDADKICWIRSEDHYLSVELQDRNMMLRGKLGQTVKALDDDLGVQINRSVWVAFSAIDRLEDGNAGALKVGMSDGTVFQVAATRTVHLRHSLSQYQAKPFADREGPA